MFEWKFVTVHRGRYFLFKIDTSLFIFDLLTIKVNEWERKLSKNDLSNTWDQI